MEKFDLNAVDRKDWLLKIHQSLEAFFGHTKSLPVATKRDFATIKAHANEFEFEKNHDAEVVLQTILEGLKNYAVHTPHPSYFGLFNPRANYISALADYITAVINPQLAAWSHAPYAAEIERKCIVEFGKKFGYQKENLDGTFCSGGAESNLTAIICALNHHFPDFSELGFEALRGRPIIYCSSESHHSILKAAKVTGLGTASVHAINVSDDLSMKTQDLAKAIKEDKAKGFVPFMIVGTAGTTGAGGMDDLEKIASIAHQEQLWFHVDAAYGGAIIVAGKYQHHLKGIEKSDSITLDLHKQFSLPMGTSIFLTSDTNILGKSFRVTTKYMPKKDIANEIIDPYVHSIQWSRRFMGLKIYLPLAIYGWQGFDEMLTHKIAMADLLRTQLKETGWQIKNQSPLAIVCFTHPDLANQDEKIVELQQAVVNSGKAWISVYPVHGKATLRACVTNYATTTKEINELVDLLTKLKKDLLNL